MELPKDFYTLSTLFSLGGSSTAVWIITSTIGYLIESTKSKKVKRWIGLILSVILALLGASLVEGSKTPLLWVVAIVNGFLIYITALGFNTILSTKSEDDGSASPQKTPRTPSFNTMVSPSLGAKGNIKSPIRKTEIIHKKARGTFREPWW